MLVILWLNYQIATSLPKSCVGLATWTFNIAILFANELSHGYPFTSIASLILPPQTTAAGKQPPPNWGTWLDSYGGLIPRWEVLFNITVLRLIAFNFDYLWSLDRRASSPIEVQHNFTTYLVLSLIHSRRKTSTPPPSPNASVSISAPNPQTSLFATTSPTSSTLRSTSPDPSSTSTTTSRNPATPSPPLAANASYPMQSASPSVS